MAVFNPEDFVFEKISLPEDNPTILEYDALHKFVIVRVSSKIKQSEYQACQLSSQVNTNLMEGLPDKFSNRNDRIVLFYIRKDGTYKLTKEKLKYDFKSKESTWVKYDYDSLTLEEAKELFDAIKASVWLQDAINIEKATQSTIELAKKDVYLDRMYVEKLNYRNKILRDSDWRILDDAPQSFDGERDLWIKWRDTLREIVKAPSEFENEMEYLIYNEEFRWPYNPEQYHNIDPEHNEEYLSSDAHWSVSKNVDMNQDKMEELTAKVNEYISRVKHREETGMPVTTQMMRVLEKYKLLENIDDLKLVEAEQ